MTPSDFRARLLNSRETIGAFIDSRGNERLRQLWGDWRQRFEDLLQQSHQRPEVAISLVGGTGAGKSTLLNALIGARLLPVGIMEPCTSAISAVGYCEAGYRARVEFISRESWEQEIEVLKKESFAAQFSIDEDAGDPAQTLSRTARKKLQAVYLKRDDTSGENLDLQNLVEPEDVRAALDQGFVEFADSDLDPFRKHLANFLDAKHRYWPIVKRVNIQGPFEVLKDGAKLVDLPGLNDPNAAREEVTKQYLKSCRFVWIVFNMKRALTRDTMAIMQSEDFLRQIVMDGRADALTLVGTHAEDFDFTAAIEEFGLDPEAPNAVVIDARNQGVRRIIQGQLGDLSAHLAQLARESMETAGRLAGQLKRSQIFTVSAKEYLRLAKLSQDRTRLLDDPNETEIPLLRDHVRQVCATHGVGAHFESLSRQVETLLWEVRREMESQLASLKNQAEVTEQQRGEMRAAITAAREFLKDHCRKSHDLLIKNLETNQAFLGDRVKLAVARAKTELEQSTLRRWNTLHHNSIAAACRRGGVHVSANGKNDFPADLCKPILDGIAFAWSEFFGEKLRNLLEKSAEQLKFHSEQFRRDLDRDLRDLPDLPKVVGEGLVRNFAATDRAVGEHLANTVQAMEDKILIKQRSMYDVVPQQVHANMQAAFKQGAEIKGVGMKNRIFEILSKHARQVSQQMFDDARTSLLQEIRSLNDWIAIEFGKMEASVLRNAATASENLLHSGERLSAGRAEQESLLTSELETLLGLLESGLLLA